MKSFHDWYETLHRELKQTTGIEPCQCRRGRIERHHIACAFLVWIRLKRSAYKTGQTIYQLKQGLLRNDIALPTNNYSRQ